MTNRHRRIGVKHLRVSGFNAVRFCATLKAVEVNIFKAIAVRKAVNNAKATHVGILPPLIHAIYVVKEHFLNAWGQLGKLFTPFDHLRDV